MNARGVCGLGQRMRQRLHLDVEASNTGARRLYERYGFEATGHSKPLRPGSTYSCDRMLLPRRGGTATRG